MGVGEDPLDRDIRHTPAPELEGGAAEWDAPPVCGACDGLGGDPWAAAPHGGPCPACGKTTEEAAREREQG